MSMIAILLISGLVTVIAVIGLADALTHLLCWSARSLREPIRHGVPSVEATGRDRLAA
jgi:hypothetical protein